MKIRDMSKSEFNAACARRGFKPEGFLGYYNIGQGVNVSILNTAPTRRAQLAYLIQQAVRIEHERAAK